MHSHKLMLHMYIISVHVQSACFISRANVSASLGTASQYKTLGQNTGSQQYMVSIKMSQPHAIPYQPFQPHFRILLTLCTVYCMGVVCPLRTNLCMHIIVANLGFQQRLIIRQIWLPFFRLFMANWTFTITNSACFGNGTLNRSIISQVTTYCQAMNISMHIKEG